MYISIIIPTYNRANFLQTAIKSVLTQTYKKFELIIIDDGSTDNSFEIIKKYPNVKYFYKKNGGVASARNYGIKLAKYEWIAFLDSDDSWRSDKLQKQIEFHKNSNLLFSHTDEKWIRGEKVIKKKSYQSKPSGECFLDNIDFCKISPSTVMLHKSILKKIGNFDESLKICEDYDLWLRISKEYNIGYINEELIIKRAGHQGQLSFSEFGIDRYKVVALKKHLNSNFHNEIKEELIKKLKILLKGAKKHNNNSYLEKYQKELDKLQF